MANLFQSSFSRRELCLELAYLLVYPLVPLGIVALYLSGLRQYIGYFWMVVLLAHYASVVITPFVQAMPPRLLEGYNNFKAPTSLLRRFNEWILRRAGIKAITFPSAHVASSFAIALVLLRLEPWVGFIFLLVAISIALATVSGGYHYVADVVLALFVALLIFTVTFRLLSL